MEIAPTQELVDKGIGWVSGNHATIEGNTLYLPGLIDGAPTKEENFAKLKVIATHQVVHQEFGSFGFSYEHPCTLFRDLRPLVKMCAIRCSFFQLMFGKGLYISRILFPELNKFP